MLFLPITPADSAATRRLPLPAPLPRLAAIVAATSIVVGSTLALDALPAAASENQPPVAVDDFYSTHQDVEIIVFGDRSVLDNDYDPDGDPLKVGHVHNVVNGKVTSFWAGGGFSFLPDAGFVGIASFEYNLVGSDGVMLPTYAVVTIEVLGAAQPQPEPAPQQAPTGTPDFYTMNAGQTLAALGAENPLGNDVDPDGDELLMVHLSMQGPALSTWTWNMNGDFWFTPPADYTGSFTVYYTLSDGVTEVPDVPITITVRESLDGAVNAAPVAEDDTWMVAPGETLVIGDPGVLGNDHDADGDALSVFAHTEPAIGSDFALAPEGSFTWTAPADFCGVTTFTYSVTDGESDSPSNDATVTIVAGMDREPVDCPEEETVTPGGSDEPTDPEQPIDPELPTDPEQPVDLELPTQPEQPELPEPLPTDPELTLTATPREQLAHTGPVSERLFAAAAASALLALALGVFAVIPPRGRRRASTR